jgi:hypothetical protein
VTPEQLSEHLDHCERCELNLPCEEWDRLYEGTQGGRTKPSKRRSAPVAGDPIEQIRRLGELRDRGLLTDEEFQTKKSELLSRT